MPRLFVQPMYSLVKYLWIFALVGFASSAAFAQTGAATDNDDIQLWNDINIIVAVADKVDLIFPITFRFTKIIGRFNEDRIGAGVIFKPHKRFAITPFYNFIKARNSAGDFRTENRLHLRFVYRFPANHFGLSHRSQFEYRIRSSGNTWRYRPSITFEKALPKSLADGLKVFVTEEPFYDSASGRFSRNRFSFGVNKSVSKNLSLDLYYLRQDDNFSGPGVVHVLGTSWKLQF